MVRGSAARYGETAVFSKTSKRESNWKSAEILSWIVTIKRLMRMRMGASKVGRETARQAARFFQRSCLDPPHRADLNAGMKKPAKEFRDEHNQRNSRQHERYVETSEGEIPSRHAAGE